MSQNRSDLERSAWREFFDLLTKAHEGWHVTIEVVSLEFGDQLEAEKLPLAYIEYDKDDDLIVAVGGRDSRYPAVLQHIINHPQKVLVDTPAPDMVMAIDVIDEEGVQTLISLYLPAALPG